MDGIASMGECQHKCWQPRPLAPRRWLMAGPLRREPESQKRPIASGCEAVASQKRRRKETYEEPKETYRRRLRGCCEPSLPRQMAC